MIKIFNILKKYLFPVFFDEKADTISIRNIDIGSKKMLTKMDNKR